MTTERYLLDTCAIIYLAHDMPVSKGLLDVLDFMPSRVDTVLASPFSAWELGMLVAKGRIVLERPPAEWFRIACVRFDISTVPLSAEVLVSASFLPEPLHGDPADRILIATARSYDLTIVTRDRAILTYGAAGHVKVLAC
ncbi:type II toxin-antitoxin system VapC family toxin [Peteryoungia desertarenae]|jgi:PIN domain nuclease of toxin-antitoxin system|uniref:Type II toxin-antitoxin system VapC family toxin n=1 Tax=Peteryoungia desertarenae TaxID=1813451 RepID=A0ABX6QRU4_9HYPH|nr:type II toxin-antitoxin system VapC family toxin [Peteryoungia desertarenae]QLF70885.1 type II toxin-antitoxin system VapC family toxin [Peteryoungia desertarenae]